MRAYAPHTQGDERPITGFAPTDTRKARDRTRQRAKRKANGANTLPDPWVTQCPTCKTKTWDIGTFTDDDGEPYLERFCVECLRRRSRPCALCGNKVNDTHSQRKFCSSKCQKADQRRRETERVRRSRAS